MKTTKRGIVGTAEERDRKERERGNVGEEKDGGNKRERERGGGEMEWGATVGGLMGVSMVIKCCPFPHAERPWC